jgi:hypothetical protein
MIIAAIILNAALLIITSCSVIKNRPNYGGYIKTPLDRECSYECKEESSGIIHCTSKCEKVK